jgi:hypothetical protein
MHELVQPLSVHTNGLHLYDAINQSYVWCCPRLPFFVCDEKDLPLVTCMKSSGSNRPCNICLIDFKETVSITPIGIKRKLQVMKEVYYVILHSDIMTDF